jgi:heat shock protein HslJ
MTLRSPSIVPALLVLVLAACAVGADGPQATAGGGGMAGAGALWGTAWRLEDLAGSPVLERVEATLAFPEAGQAAGSGSCNRFFATVTISGDSISFSAIGSTRMACEEPVGAQEAKYLSALQSAERFVVDGAALSIHCEGMDQPLRFVRTSP